jgi:hypothetical protein
MTEEDYDKLKKEIVYNRQMQRKRLYEQAKRGLKKGAGRGQKSS